MKKIKNLALLLVVLALAFVVIGCSNDTPAPPAKTVSSADIETVARALVKEKAYVWSNAPYGGKTGEGTLLKAFKEAGVAAKTATPNFTLVEFTTLTRGLSVSDSSLVRKNFKVSVGGDKMKYNTTGTPEAYPVIVSYDVELDGYIADGKNLNGTIGVKQYYAMWDASTPAKWVADTDNRDVILSYFWTIEFTIGDVIVTVTDVPDNTSNTLTRTVSATDPNLTETQKTSLSDIFNGK